MQLPVFSIVTPTKNQARFIAETVESVIAQNGVSVEYAVIDGGSGDGTVEIVKKYEKHLSYWCSEPDNGVYDAVKKGFAKTTGEIMGWINGDDKYLPGALATAGEIFARYPEIEWLTSRFPLGWDATGRCTAANLREGYTAEEFFRGEYLSGGDWYAEGAIQQESTFWRRSLYERAGGLDGRFRLAGDFDLWARFFRLAGLYAVAAPLAGFREHPDQLSAVRRAEYMKEALSVLEKSGGGPRGPFATMLRTKLDRFVGRKIAVKLGLLPAHKVLFYDARAGEWLLRKI